MAEIIRQDETAPIELARTNHYGVHVASDQVCKGHCQDNLAIAADRP